jgi:hypothetical protein
MQSAFLPRTTLAPDEQRMNFTMIDNAVMDLLTSPEAEAICSKMFLIYARLKRADWKLWERPGVLGVTGDGEHTAWQILCDLAGVASATLNKALKWMAERKVIAYFAKKNGIGIRIYFNVAATSIKSREKNLRLVPTSPENAPASFAETPLSESVAFLKNQNSDVVASRDLDTPTASPTESAAISGTTEPTSVVPEMAPFAPTRAPLRLVPPVPAQPAPTVEVRLLALEAFVRQIDASLRKLAKQVPDRDWLERVGLPKMTRVLFAEFYRKQPRGKSNNADVGASPPTPPAEQAVRLPAYSAFWQSVLPRIQSVVSEQNFQAWFAPLNVIQRDGASIITAPDKVFQEWLEGNYADVLDGAGLTNRGWEFTL